MRPGELECSSRLGDRVRWLPYNIEPDTMSANPVGIVIAMKRRLAHKPDMATDSILIRFDERVSLGSGGGGIRQQWVPPEQIEDEVCKPFVVESESP